MTLRVLAQMGPAAKTAAPAIRDTMKTHMTIPYTSVFIRLDCKYWSADQEKNLRLRMGAAQQK